MEVLVTHRTKEAAMTVTDYLLHLFYLVDAEIKALDLPKLRRRGPQPKLSDSEVITMEVAAEFLRIDTDKGAWRHFRQYHRSEFPALAQVDRTTYCRQAAALWRVTQLLNDRVLAMLPLADPADGRHWWIIDSFPLRVCRLTRAKACKLFAGLAGYGRDPTLPFNNYFGLRVHLRASDRGPVAQLQLTSASTSDLSVAAELSPHDLTQPCLGDRNYWHEGRRAEPHRRWQLARAGMRLIAPFKQKKFDPDPARSRLLSRLRQVIEPVIGQLATRFAAERTWARDLWHLTARLWRKILSHSTALLLNWRAGNDMLKLDLLLDA
jgi:DDE family transposase